MIRGNVRRAILSGLIVVGTLVAAGKDALAVAVAVGSIKVTGGIVQVGDPQYTYQLAVFLDGNLKPNPPTTVSLNGLSDVDGNSVIQIIDQAGIVSPTTWTAAQPGRHKRDLDTHRWADLFGASTNLLIGIFEVTTDPSINLPAGYPSD